MIMIHDDEEDEWQSLNSDDVVEKNPTPSSIIVFLNLVIVIYNTKDEVMIDPVAINNFFSLAIIVKLGFPITSTYEFRVTLGTG